MSVYLCLYLYLCVYFHVEGLLVRCKGGYVCVYGAALKFIRKLQITQNFPNCENLPKIKVGKGILQTLLNFIYYMAH